MKPVLAIFSNFLIILILLSARPAQAFYAVMDTADVVPAGQFNLGADVEGLFNGAGVFVNAHGDGNVKEDSSYRVLFTGGNNSYQFGAFYKFAPLPDYNGQPGFAISSGVVYANTNSSSILSFKIIPILSKKLERVVGGETLTPYVAVPFGLSAGAGQVIYPIHFALGTKWQTSWATKMAFWGEVGAQLNSAESYIAGGLSVPID